MTPNNPSKPVPLEAVEAAANALHDKHWPSVHNHGAPCSLCIPYAETAIHAFLDAMGVTVEEQARLTTAVRTEQQLRLVSAWFPIKGPVDE